MPQVKGAPTPHDEPDYVTELQEQVLGLLEAAGIDTETNDKIVSLIWQAERRMIQQQETDSAEHPVIDPYHLQQ